MADWYELFLMIVLTVMDVLLLIFVGTAIFNGYFALAILFTLIFIPTTGILYEFYFN